MSNALKKMVYIIDDDESVRRAFKRLIRTLGIETKTFASVREFLDSHYHTEGACVITDLKMPDMDGLDLKRELLQAGSELSVIIVTAYDTPESQKEAKNVGITSYLRKPVDDNALLDVVQWTLQ